MGTNYYLEPEPCPCPCVHCTGGERLHIGKSSAGWCFSLHVTDQIKSLDDWRALWSKPGARIVDEYGNTWTPRDMEHTITERNGRRAWDDASWLGYGDEDDFHAQNHSQRGPNNLLRHRLDRYCVGHGDGTYDLVTGEFC